MGRWVLIGFGACVVTCLAVRGWSRRQRRRARIAASKNFVPPRTPAVDWSKVNWGDFFEKLMPPTASAPEPKPVRGGRLSRPGALLDLFGFLFGRATRDDIEATITDLGLDAEDMRARGFSERWIFFIIKTREVRELAAFLW